MKPYQLYLEEFKEHIELIRKDLIGKNKEDFERDKDLQRRVSMSLIVIGEAVNKIPKILKEKNKEIPWEKLGGFRDLLAHEYSEVNLSKLFEYMQANTMKIKEALGRIKLV